MNVKRKDNIVSTQNKYKEDNRLSILSILILFLAGGILLARVDVKKGEQMARDFLGRVQ